MSNRKIQSQKPSPKVIWTEKQLNDNKKALELLVIQSHNLNLQEQINLKRNLRSLQNVIREQEENIFGPAIALRKTA